MGHTIRVAYLSPLAPQCTDSAYYSEDLLPHLCRHVQVDAYTDDHVAATQEVGRLYPLYGYRDLAAQRERYDLLLFQLGSSPEHLPVFEIFLQYGGVAVLHDLDLVGLAESPALQRQHSPRHLREPRRHERLGLLLRAASDAVRHGQWPPACPAPPEVSRLLAQRAAGLIVHTGEARAHLQAQCPGARVCEVAVGIPRPPAIDSLEARQVLGLPSDALICLTAGRLEPEARIHVAMQAFARFAERSPNSLYVIVGEPAPGYPVHELAEALGIGERVRLERRVDLATLYRYLAAADVGISLGSPRRGEVPAGLLRTMSMGKPAIVSRRSPYAGIPDHCVIPVDEGVAEVGQVVAALWALAGHPPLRLSYGRQAARYVQAQHALSAAARQYAEFLEEIVAEQPAEKLLVHEAHG